MEYRTLLLALVAAACSPFTTQPGPSGPSAPPAEPAAPANPCNVDPTAPNCDRDRDMVPDTRDACPDTAGPANGCPLPDADEDGVADPSDRCPNTRENLNGYQDDDGCADENPTQDPAFSHPLVLEAMPAGKSTLDGSTRLALDDYAIALRNAQGIHFQISGHTDLREASSEPARQQLGQRRAEAVRDYLIKKWGIDPARIEVLGAGGGKPVADNDDAAGRARNRRVEIVASQR